MVTLSMSGYLVEDIVVIEDQKEGCQLYNKGNFGYPQRGGGLQLDLVEATFLLECNRLDVVYNGSKMSFEDMFDYASSTSDEFDIKYLVYRDIRQRGFIVKLETGAFDFSVFPRGSSMSNSRPVYMVRATSERTALNIDEFLSEIRQSENKGKELLYGVVDEEGDLTYYMMSTKDPKGQTAGVSTVEAKGVLICDRVFVFDRSQAEAIHAVGHYGKLLGGVLQLSLIEGCYLVSKGMLEVCSAGNLMLLEDLLSFGKGVQDEFDLRIRAFIELRKRELVVKTGFKYGTHFRVYEKSPEECHARYLVHAVPASKITTWPEISRTVRLSGGVKKEILFCRISDDVEFIEFKWFRP